jgi:hypothetical protein
MTYYLSVQNFFLFISAIDFNVVNPSNNTFNRQKIIITIFVNETKCHFEFHIGTKNLMFVEDHPMNIHVQFGFNNIHGF